MRYVSNASLQSDRGNRNSHQIASCSRHKLLSLSLSTRRERDAAGKVRDYAERRREAVTVGFCRRLSELPEEKKEGRAYRLPTEAEWEYACRAGSNTAYSFGDLDEQVGDYAWCAKLANRQTHPVGQKRPNAWGLYDLHGNVGEWCQDWCGDYPPRKNVVDPSGPPSGEFRVIRGGSWFEAAAKCRSASRLADWANAKSHACGFRVVLPISE